MLQRVRAIVEWSKVHQGRVVLIAGVLFSLIKLLDWTRALVGRGNAIAVIWDVVAFLGEWCVPVTVAAILLYAHWPAIKRRIVGPPFEVRPICGQSLIAPPERDVIAKLAIKNIFGRQLKRVSIRLMAVFRIGENGALWNSEGMFPSIHPERGETFLLRWAAGESSIEDHKYLDIPSDGAERIADCLILDRRNPAGVAYFAAANKGDLQDRLCCIGSQSWWKLEVIVAAECGTSERVELVAGVADRDPGPISLFLWNPRGEQIVQHLQTEFQKQREHERQQPKLQTEQSTQSVDGTENANTEQANG